MAIFVGVTFHNFGDLGHEVFGHVNYHNFESKSYSLLDNTEERETHRNLKEHIEHQLHTCLLYTSPSPRDLSTSRMPSSA